MNLGKYINKYINEYWICERLFMTYIKDVKLL